MTQKLVTGQAGEDVDGFFEEKNDRRNSGGTLRQNVNFIDIQHLTFNQRTNEPIVQWTNRPMDQWTNGPMDQWTNGPMDQQSD